MEHDNAPERRGTRKRALTEEDAEVIQRIIESVMLQQTMNQHTELGCRFHGIQPDEFMEIVKSHRKFNAMMSDSKKTARNVIIGLVITLIVGLLSEGFWSKILVKLKE